MQAELICQLPVKNSLGEGVLWDVQTGCIWWTDILDKKLYSYHLANEDLSIWETPERLTCFALVEDQDMILAGFESGFAYFNPDLGRLDWVQKIEADNPGTRLNDGRTDRQGRFWVGSIVENADTATSKAKLYSIDSQHRVASHLDNIEISNGLCWSPCSNYLYHTDTPSHCIKRYAFDKRTGMIGEGEEFAVTEPDCYPDGSIVDADGFLLNAQWGGSKVVRYTPEGEVDCELTMPVSQPTCVAIGGDDLDLLIVTSASVGVSANEPDAGDLFIYKTDLRGVLEKRFVSSVFV